MDHVENKNVQALRAYRQRRRNGLAVLPIELNPAACTAALARKGIVPADRPLSRAELARAVAAVIEHWTTEAKS